MWYPNRVACDVLQEMRNMVKTLNFAGLEGSVEELQAMFNRMESSLEDNKDLEHMKEHRKDLKREIKALQKKRNKLQNKVSIEEVEINGR